MIKMLLSLFTGAGLLIASYNPVSLHADSHNRGCTGSANCTACSNCSGCAHCNSGGTCGVCSGGSSKKKLTLSETIQKRNLQEIAII